jgi:MoxR-like ATPase
LDGAKLSELAAVVRRVAVTRELAMRATQIARQTRPEDDLASEAVQKNVRWGAGPRASQYIVLGAKARAALAGSPIVRQEDIDAVAKPVLRHRIKLNFQAESEGLTPDDVIQEVLASVDSTLRKGASDGAIEKVLRS